jgi:diacylglycerol kinase (ATP)
MPLKNYMTETCKYLFIVNPISGANDKKVFFEVLEEMAISENFSFDFFTTTGHNDYENLLSFLTEKKVEILVAVGGDGTLNLTGKVAVETGHLVGLIPMGSANGMARELDIPREDDMLLIFGIREKVRLAFKILLKGKIRPVDVTLINNQHISLHLSDIGINAKVIKRFEQEKIRGFRGYMRQYFKELRHKRQIKYRLLADGKFYKGKSYMIVIANAQKYGTGAVINPQGKTDDGYIELCIVKNISFKGIMLAFYSVFNKNALFKFKDLKIISCKKSQIRLERPEVLQVDGEIIGETDRIEAQIKAAAIKMIC